MGAFGPEQKASAARAKQMGLFDALELLREAQLDTEVIGKTGEYFELRIRIRSSKGVLSR